MDDDYTKNLLPADFESWSQITNCVGVTGEGYSKLPNYEAVDLPPFIKAALIKIVKSAQSRA
jgi:hypothetical protein